MKTRHIAHIVIEADTPLKVGSNASDFLQDSPIQRDFNGLPMILGTSIAGVLRKDFDKEKVADIFGEENGSKVIFSNALLCINAKNEVCEELLPKKTPFLKLFDTLPIREHTAITEKGVAKEHAKFDEEVLYKGTRFKFSIEVLEDEESFKEILSLLSSASFRLGGGSTKGFGKLNILEIKRESFNIDSYENYSSSLNHKLKEPYEIKQTSSKTHTNYRLKITPEDFFIFGSGFGDEDADATPVYEYVIDYDKEDLGKKQILIPASSIKGALAHRVTFHYNSLVGNTIEAKNGLNSLEAIFGSAKDSKDKTKQGSKGKLILSDCFQDEKTKTKTKTKTFDHVSIDRFTGGAIDGALFQEKTIAQKDMWEIEILLHKDVQEEALKAFEKALIDISTGMLPLGGMTTKGHGVFVGEVLKDGKELEHD
jgi:CRISPR/Cas system CSM-associated protein Csm3 (group 7 of RAMP superfamily)